MADLLVVDTKEKASTTAQLAAPAGDASQEPAPPQELSRAAIRALFQEEEAPNGPN